MARILPLAALAFTLWILPTEPFLAPLRAAAAFVQETSCTGNDAVCTFGNAPSAGNLILITTVLSSETNTVAIDDWTPVETVLFGPVDSTVLSARGYVVCVAGDGADTTMTITTSGAASSYTAAIEVSGIGTDCQAALDDAEVPTELDCEGSGGMSHSLATALTTTASGDFIVAMVHASNTADYTAGSGYTLSPSSGTEIATFAIAQWKVGGASGSEDPSWTSAANETTVCFGAAFKAAGGGPTGPPAGSLQLLGVGI